MLVYIIAVAYICFGRINNLQHIPRHFLGFETDKVIHFCMFFPFMIISFFCFRNIARKPLKSLLWTVCTFLVGAAFAALTEIIQSKLVYRCGDFRDFNADTLALGITSLIVMAINFFIRHHREKA